MDDDAVILDLSKPITAHGETLSQLSLRSPTVKEFIAAGRSPYVVAGDGTVAPDMAVCAKLLSMICGIPPSSVDQLAPADFFRAVWQVVGFTGQSQAAEV
jgi:Phage tail assembly chaperone proteins, E, or 41 or 14